MKYLSLLLFVLMNGLSMDSGDATLTEEQLIHLRSFSNNASDEKDVVPAEAFGSWHEQAEVEKWKPDLVLGMNELFEFYQSWIAEPICKVLVVASQNEDPSRIKIQHMGTSIDLLFKELIVNKWKYLNSEEYEDTILMESPQTDSRRSLKNEMGDRLNSLAKAHADATNGYSWNLRERGCFIEALGEISPVNMDEVVKTYRIIVQGHIGSAEDHASMIRILSKVPSNGHEQVRSAYQIFTRRNGCNFRTQCLQDVELSYPYVSVEEWEASLDSITDQDEPVNLRLSEIEPIIASLVAAQKSYNCAADSTDVILRYFLGNAFPSYGATVISWEFLIETFAKIEYVKKKPVARAAMLLLTPFTGGTSKIHVKTVLDAFEKIPVELIDPVTKAIVIIKTKGTYVDPDHEKVDYTNLIKALLGLSKNQLMPVAKEIAQRSIDRDFHEDKEVQLVKEVSGLLLVSDTRIQIGGLGMGW